MDSSNRKRKLGATKHCAYGTCNSDSRYADRPEMDGVFFIRFPKPGKDLEKCVRWVKACSRVGFDETWVKKDTYLCSLHFIGGKGPTEDHPDPIPANATKYDVNRLKKTPRRKVRKSLVLSEVHNTDKKTRTMCPPQLSEDVGFCQIQSKDHEIAEILLSLSEKIINCVFGSYKKGVVHWADDYECDDFKVLNNMAWWYDYRPNLDTYYKNKICDTPVGHYIQTFVPMIWGKKSNTSIPDKAKYLLGFNEPNHINQANMTATEAANYWVSQIKPLKINGLPKLASPSAAPCGKNCVDDRDTWFKDFFNKCKDCEIDYLATHTYMCNANQVMRHLERLHANYSLPIWLTEFACGDETDETLMLNFMKEVLPRLEAAPFVYRYSWYKARITKDHYVKKAASLLDPLRTSNLTPLGIFYNGFEGTVQVDGVWAEWSVWSACEVSCGGGQTTRSRQCVYPNKLQKDLPCIGVSDENKSCNTQSCPTSNVANVFAITVSKDITL